MQNNQLLMLSRFEALNGINRQGSTILLVEQNARPAYVLENGLLAQEDSPAELFGNPEVKKASTCSSC